MDQSFLDKALTIASANQRHELERFSAQRTFANSLCELHPAKAKAWRPLIDKAAGIVERAIEAGGVDGLGKAVRAAEQAMAPLAAAAKSYNVHCVGHAHIDMNWMWSWPETVAVTNDTVTTVLKLLDEFPTFHFSQSQASIYQIIEQYNPALLPRIAKYVKQGRWEVTASHWVEGDKNIAGGEALCRHLLYTRQYMKHLFGLSPEDVNIDWSPDTFGHAATVPTYLVRGGVKYLYLHRPGVHTPKRPGAFWWQGPDGSRVLVRNDMVLAYNGVITPQVARHLVNFTKETGSRDYMFVFGVGDHGGGPTRRDLLRGLDMATWPIFPNVKFSTAREFYEALEKQSGKLPTLDYELNTEFTGCYTTETLIKKANRFAEARLADTEWAGVMAWAALGREYPAAQLLEGWRDTLFSQFHDILPGSGVHDTRTYTHGTFQKTMAMTSMAETGALRALAAAIDTSSAAETGGSGGARQALKVSASAVASALGAGVGFGTGDGKLSLAEQSGGDGPRPFVVFNPTAFDREEIIEATIWDNVPWGGKPLRDRAFMVRRHDGQMEKPQTIQNGGYWGHEFATLAFPVRVAGLGYALYTVEEQTSAAPPAAGPGIHGIAGAQAPATTGARQLWYKHHTLPLTNERGGEGLTNDLVQMELDPLSGGIRSLTDLRSGIKLITPERPAPVLEYILERPHSMTAWLVDFSGPPEAPQCAAVRRKLSGPHKASLEVDLKIHESNFTLTYELHRGDPRLHLHLTGTWFERGTRETGIPALRLSLPLALEEAKARYEIPFGAVDRNINNGQELPALRWAMVSGKSGRQMAGCVLSNDSKHGHSLEGNVLRLTLIRSSYDPDPLPEIGKHEVHLSLAPFSGALSVAEATNLALELNHGLRVVGTDVHQGMLETTGQFLNIEPKNLVVSGIKKAEDGQGLIVRLYETAGRRTTARIQLDASLLGRPAKAHEVDLMERPIAKSSAKVAGNSGGAVSVVVPAYGIASVRVELKA